MTRHLAVLVGAMVVPSTALAIGPSEVRASAQSLSKAIALMERDLGAVAEGYGKPVPKVVGNRVERRLREGEIHFLLNDYLRASIVLLDVVDDERSRSHPRYDDCVYFLAESLRRTKNFSGARRYFEEILPRATGDRLREVVIALLEIAGATRNYDRVGQYLARLREANGASRPDVQYIHAKMLFGGSSGDATRLRDALQRFEAVSAGTPVSARASYFAGVTLVSLGDLKGALAKFKDALTQAKASEDGAPIAELAHMALGRLHHELGDPIQAIDSYGEIERTSKNFSDMLFEVAWTHVKAASQLEDADEKQSKLRLALETSEILMASAPGHRLFPEARILEGNLQIKLGASETAYGTFQSIVDRYGRASDELETLMRANQDPRGFFEQLVVDDDPNILERRRTASFLPPIAVEWANRSPHVSRAVSVVKDLSASRKFLDESRELARTLNEALKGEQRYTMFTGIAEARNKAFTVENRLVLANRRLLSLERRMVEPHLDSVSEAQLYLMAARRRALEEDIQKLPQSVDAVNAVTSDILDNYRVIDRRVFKQRYEVASMRAQIAATDVWLSEERKNFSDEQVKLMSDRLANARSALQALEASVEALQADVRTARSISGGDAGRVRAHRVRQSYSKVMLEEFQVLRGLRNKLPSELRATTSLLDEQRTLLAKIASDLDRLQTNLDQQIEGKVSEARAQLLTELERLERYEREETGLASETDRLLGPVAASSLSAVAGEFRNLVLRADVGIIDVAWARKEAETKQVNELVQKQQQQMQELETEFSDVLEEDE